MTCPHCQEPARFKGYRPKGLLSVLGPADHRTRLLPLLPLPSRPLPRRRRLRLGHGDLTSGAAELTSLAGTLDNFARAADVVLPKMSGLSIAESTVERTTEAIGCELGQAMEAKVAFGEARPWDWHHDAEGKTCAYVSIDSTGVAKQGPGSSGRRGGDGRGGDGLQPGPRRSPTVGQTEGPAAALAGAIRGQPGGPRGRGRAVASPGRPGRHGPGAAVDRHQRWRRGAGGLAAGPLRPGRRGDPGLLPRLGTPGGLRQGVVLRRRRRRPRRSTRSGRTGSNTRAGRRSWNGSRAWISREIPERGRPGRRS